MDVPDVFSPHPSFLSLCHEPSLIFLLSRLDTPELSNSIFLLEGASATGLGKFPSSIPDRF